MLAPAAGVVLVPVVGGTCAVQVPGGDQAA
jgi:hypothetical protein